MTHTSEYKEASLEMLMLWRKAHRWTLVVNGKTVANNDATMLGSFDYHIPIGHTLDSSDNSIGIEIKVWYNWDNDGSPAQSV